MTKKILYVFVFFLIIAFLLCSCENSTRPRQFDEGVSINGIDISGLCIDEATAKLTAKLPDLLSDIKLTVAIADKEEVLSADSLGISANISAALQRAMSNDASQQSIQLSFAADEAAIEKCCKELAKKHDTPAAPASCSYAGNGKFSYTDPTSGRSLDIHKLTRDIKSAVSSGEYSVTARFTDTEYNGELTLDALKQNTKLIAKYTTNFNRSPLNAENRVKNIVKAAQLVDGTRVLPGKCFDTNATLGDRNAENGWYKATGIRNGKYNLEYGGGVCQLSSTLYNAVLLCDLEVVDRTPHSWPMSYVPIGLDATISTDGPNFVFRNTTASTLTLAAIPDTENNTLTVMIFGAPSTEYAKIHVYSEQVGTIPAPAPTYVTDTSIQKGTSRVDRKSRNGKKTVTYRIFYDENGNVIENEVVCRDTYRAIGARILVNE